MDHRTSSILAKYLKNADQTGQNYLLQIENILESQQFVYIIGDKANGII